MKGKYMSFGTAVQSFWSNWNNFNGRARRSEYWFAFLFQFLAGVVAGMVDGILFGVSSNSISPVASILWLIFIIPSIAVAVRRLHDAGYSGWFLLLVFVPFGAIAVLVFLLMDSKREENQWGPSPKYSGV